MSKQKPVDPDTIYIPGSRELVFAYFGEDCLVSPYVDVRNVGVKGDERVYGKTIILLLNTDDPVEFLHDNSERLDKVMRQLCGSIEEVVRVAVDVSPNTPADLPFQAPPEYEI